MSNQYGVGQEFGEFGETAEFGETEFGELGETAEFGELGELGETYESSEQFLGGILGSLIGETGSGLSEAQEVELASELLEVTSERELEQFLGNVFKKVVRGAGNFIRSPIGRAVGGVLKGVAKRALPVVGGALGSMVAPGIGTAIGSKLGSLAGGLLETEGLSQEQAEMEVARRVVRVAASTARNAAAARPRPTINPRTVARAAVTRAARQHAPAIYRGMIRSLRAGIRPRSGVRPRPGIVPTPFLYGPATLGPTPSPGVDDGAPYGPAPAADGGGDPFAGAATDGGTDSTDIGLGAPMTGRWFRRGHKIVVVGA